MIQEMYAEIQARTEWHSVSELCSIYGVSRSGYYKWLHRVGRPNRFERTQQILDNLVMDIHIHHPMMGYRQIRDKLCLEFGWIVSDPTVWKSMKRLSIHGYYRRRRLPNSVGMDSNISSRTIYFAVGLSKYMICLVPMRNELPVMDSSLKVTGNVFRRGTDFLC